MKKFEILTIDISEAFVTCDEAEAYRIIREAVMNDEFADLKIAMAHFVRLTVEKPQTLEALGISLMRQGRMNATNADIPTLTDAEVKQATTDIIAGNEAAIPKETLAQVMFHAARLAMVDMVNKQKVNQEPGKGINVPGESGYRQ